jgi:hypothetical protein
MTREIRTTIEPRDIVAAEFECNGCHARLTLAVSDFAEPRQFCPHCNARWYPHIGGNAYSAVQRLVTGIAEYTAAAANKDVELGVAVRLQLAPHEESGSH